MRNILIVDDAAVCRELLAATLQANGYRVFTASDGFGAMQGLTDHQPGLVILDVEMPGMDGLTFLQWMRSDAKWQDVPVILLTDVEDPKQIKIAAGLHVREYLLKSRFELGTLLGRVKKHLFNAA
jgi:DNA-binding response OmpR family regulator